VVGRDVKVGNLTLAIGLSTDEDAEIRTFCARAGITPREALLASVRNTVPEVAANALEAARQTGILEGRAAARMELAAKLDKAAEIANRAEQLAVRYTEGLARLEACYAKGEAMADPKAPIPTAALAWWTRCARAVL
jgi:hypothetical protein